MRIFSGKTTWDALTRVAMRSGVRGIHVHAKVMPFLEKSISQFDKIISIKKPETDNLKNARNTLVNCKSQIEKAMQLGVEAPQSESPSFKR